MKLSLAFLIIFLGSCRLQTWNSNSGDAKPSLCTVIDRGDQNLVDVCEIIQNRCIDCHTGYHDEWFAYTDSAAWVSAGLVDSNGDTNLSQFYTYLKNVGGSMPKNDAQIPDDEFELIKKWIQGI